MTDTPADKPADTPADKPADTLLSDKPADQAVSDKPADKPADAPADKPADGDGKKDGDGKQDDKTGAPEKYEFKAPEGVELDTALVDKFTPLAKELNLSQDQAQKLVDLYAGAAQQLRDQQYSAWEETQTKWVNDAKADKEFGGDKFDENLAVAKKALAAFGTPELSAALLATGAGNHPEFIRFCVRVGNGLGEDKMVSAAAAGGKKSPAEIMFGSTTKSA